jgi:hypothetical protein
MKKTKSDILAYIKHKSDEPGDYATDDRLVTVLTIVGKNPNNRRFENGFNNKSNKRQEK